MTSPLLRQVNKVRYIVSISRCGGLRIRRLLLVGCSSCGILGCDSTSGDSIPASVFGCIGGFDSYHWLLLPMSGMGLKMPPPWSAKDGSDFDASAFQPGSPQCTNEGPGVV